MYGFKKGSRILNDKRFLFSLTMKDFVGILFVFVVFSSVLDDTPYALFAFVIAFVFGAMLAPIRIKHRDFFIRDFAMHYIIKAFGGRL